MIELKLVNHANSIQMTTPMAYCLFTLSEYVHFVIDHYDYSVVFQVFAGGFIKYLFTYLSICTLLSYFKGAVQVLSYIQYIHTRSYIHT